MSAEPTDQVAAAIQEWARPDDELGWPGSAEVALHAEENRCIPFRPEAHP